MTITVGVPLMVCPDERACTGWMCKTQGCIRMMGGIPRERNITGEMAFGEGLDSADAELAHSLKSIVTVDYRWDPHALSIIARYERDRHMAADKIAAQDRHIMHWRGSFLAEQKANEELKSRIEAQAREIAAEVSAKFQWGNAYERALGDYHTVRKERDTLKARVAELEANVSLYQVGRLDLTEAISVLETRAEQAEAKAARLVELLERALGAWIPRNTYLDRDIRAALAEAGHGG